MDSMRNRKSKMVSRHTGFATGNVKYYQRCVCICFATNHQCGGCRSKEEFLDFHCTVSWNIIASDFAFSGKSFCE